MKNPWRDYTTQLFGDHNKPLQGSRHETTSIMESKSVFFRGSFDFSLIFSLNCHLQQPQKPILLSAHQPPSMKTYQPSRKSPLEDYPGWMFCFFDTKAQQNS